MTGVRTHLAASIYPIVPAEHLRCIVPKSNGRCGGEGGGGGETCERGSGSGTDGVEQLQPD